MTGFVLLLALCGSGCTLLPSGEAGRLLHQARAEMAQPDGGSASAIAQALEAAQATGASMPDYFHHHLAVALYRLGEFEGARQHTERYLQAHGAQARYAIAAQQLQRFAEIRLDEEQQRGVWQRFEWHDRAVGELRDHQTGLIWQACSSRDGVWEGRGCSGQSRLGTWDEAVAFTRAESERSSKSWRLPRADELMSASAHFPGRLRAVNWAVDGPSDSVRWAVSEGAVARRSLSLDTQEGLAEPVLRTEQRAWRLVR